MPTILTAAKYPAWQGWGDLHRINAARFMGGDLEWLAEGWHALRFGFGRRRKGSPKRRRDYRLERAGVTLIGEAARERGETLLSQACERMAAYLARKMGG